MSASMPAVGWAVRLAAIGWTAFVALTVALVADPPTDVDHDVQAAVARLGARVVEAAPAAHGLSTVVAHLGAASVLVPVVVAVGAGWWWRRRTVMPAVVVGGAYLLMAVVVSSAKGLLARPEPYDAAGSLGRSFPSGHTASAVVVWGGAAVCWWLWSNRDRRRDRALIAALAGVAVAAVAATMVGRSAHWLSDVLAGAAVGVACLSTVGVAVAWWEGRRSARLLRPPAAGTAIG